MSVTKIVRSAMRGDHVTIGKAVTIWHVDYVQHYPPGTGFNDFVMVDRVTTDRNGYDHYSRRRFPAARLVPAGKHVERVDGRDGPQNCADCGCYREVARR